MSLVEPVIERIHDAFSNVKLDDGVSLLEASVIEYNGTDQERAEARARDERNDWRAIPDQRIEESPSALCFMDVKGVRFHLPAYMSFSLRRHLDAAESADSAIDYLSNAASLDSLRPVLSENQIQAITTFLATCLELGEEWLDADDVRLTMRAWDGDEQAAVQLRTKKRDSESQWRSAEERVLSARKRQDRWFLAIAVVVCLCILYCIVRIVIG